MQILRSLLIPLYFLHTSSTQLLPFHTLLLSTKRGFTTSIHPTTKLPCLEYISSLQTLKSLLAYELPLSPLVNSSVLLAHFYSFNLHQGTLINSIPFLKTRSRGFHQHQGIHSEAINIQSLSNNISLKASDAKFEGFY